MRDLRMPAWALAAAIAGGGAPGGCDGQEGVALGPDGGTDTGTEWESPIDGSVWDTESDAELDTEVPCDCGDPLCGIGYTCTSGVKECPCDTVCDDGYYGAIGWSTAFDNYRCYEPCVEGGTCAREGDVCTALLDGETLCLPHTEATCEGFDIKVVPEEQAGSITDTAQVDVALTLGGDVRHLIMAFAYSAPPYGGNPAAVELAIMESGIGEFYYLLIDIWQDGWAPGTLVLSDGTGADGGTGEPVADFGATLYRITASGDMWYVGPATSGTIELIETPEIAVCDGPGCPKALFGAIQIEMAGPEAEIAE